MKPEFEIQMTVEEIKKLIPHRYPFLLVDRMIYLEPDVKAVGLKNVTANEPFFPGHFPEAPIMPGVLIIEALAQTGAVFVMKTMGESTSPKKVYFLTIDEARFRRPVTPGDTLHLHVSKIKSRGTIWKLEAKATLPDGTVCTDAVISAMIVND